MDYSQSARCSCSLPAHEPWKCESYFIRSTVNRWWARGRGRSSIRPLLVWVIVVFCLGVCFGVALSFAFSALSSKNAEGEGTLVAPLAYGSKAGAEPAVSLGATVIDGSAVRASRPLPGARIRFQAEIERQPTSPSIGTSHPDRVSDVWVLGIQDEKSGLARTTSLEHTSTVIEPIAQSIEQIITNAAIEFSVDPAWLLRVAFCESSYRPDAIGDHGASVGLFQIQRAFWSEVAPRLGYVGDLRHDPVASSRVAAYAFANGRAGAWTCAKGATP